MARAAYFGCCKFIFTETWIKAKKYICDAIASFRKAFKKE